MRRIWRVSYRAVAAVLAVLLAATTAPTYAAGLPDGWYTRGRTLQRNALVEGDFGYLDPVEAFSLNVGLSVSQPLNVDGKIYHMAGNALWEIDPMVASRNSGLENVPHSVSENGAKGYNPGAKILAEDINDCVRGDEGDGDDFDYCEYSHVGDLPYRPSSSGLTYREVGSYRVLFFGTGNNQVCAYNLDTTDLNCAPLDGAEPITSTPLVFVTQTMTGPQDVVVTGDKAGNLWFIQNLSGPGQYIARNIPVGGWVTVSPSWTGEDLTVMMAADGVSSSEGNGLVAKFKIVPYDPILQRGLDSKIEWKQYMPYGIADGMTVDGPFSYVSDVDGNMYRFLLSNGTYETVSWEDAFLDSRGVFANQMAAIDDEHAYFSILQN